MFGTYRRPKRSSFILSVVAAIVITMSAVTGVFAANDGAPHISGGAKTYYEYIFDDVGMRLLLPEDWTFRVENSDEHNYVFFGPNIMSEIQMYTVSLDGDDPGMTAEEFAIYLLSQYSKGTTNFKILSTPVPFKCGSYDASMIAFSHTGPSGIENIRVEIAGFTDTHMFRFILAEKSEDFLRDIDYYESIVSSLSVGPMGSGVLSDTVAKGYEEVKQGGSVAELNGWRTVAYFNGGEGSGLTEDIAINGSKMRVSYDIPEGQISVSVYDSATKKVVSPLKTLSSQGSFEVDAGTGTYFLNITCLKGTWKLFVEENYTY